MIKLIFCCLIFCSSLFADKEVEALKEQVLNVLTRLDGWCSREKAVNFIDLVLETKPETCVEIGVFGGASLFPVASTLKFLGKGTVIGIDPWDRIECIKYFDPVKDKANLDWWGKVNLNYIYFTYMNTLIRYGLEPYTLTLKTTSEKAIAEIDTIDILHWDGNHNETASTRDISLYLPKVRQGGYIWINDSIWPEVQPAVDLLVESCDVVKLIDNGNCILFKKR